MPSLEGHPIEEFGVQVGRAWALGQKGKNNGVLILMAVQEREVRIEVGYGLEGALTDAQSSWIIRNIMAPAFRQQQYAEGFSRAVDAIAAAVAGEFSAEPKASNETGQGLAVVLFLIFLLIPIALIYYLITTGSAWQSPGQRPTYWSGRNRGIDIGGAGGWGGFGGGGFGGGTGGGFSGGGGSFGGGGASGRW